MLISIHYSEIKCYLINDQISKDYNHTKRDHPDPQGKED